MKNAKPGDVITIAAGDYLGVKTGTTQNRAGWFVSMASGTAAAPITLRGASSTAKPVLHGGSNSDAYILHMIGANYWKIENIIWSTGAKGLIFDGCNNMILDGLEVFNVGDEGVHFRDGSSNNLIQNSWIHDTGRGSPGFGEGVYIGSADGTNQADGSPYNQLCHDNRVSNCRFGPNIAAEAVDIKERTKRAIVEHCTFDATGTDNKNSVDSVINVKGNDAIVRYNTIKRAGNPNILWAFKIYSVWSAGDDSGMNNQFTNNDLYLDDDTTAVLYVQQGRTGLVSQNTRYPSGTMWVGTVKDTTPQSVPTTSGATFTWMPVGDAMIRDGTNVDKNYAKDLTMDLNSIRGIES